MKKPAFIVHHLRRLHPGGFILRLDRHDLPFEPGQYVSVGFPGSLARRDYSIYSGLDDDFLEVLVREIDGGTLSCALGRCARGDALCVDGPYGLFVTDPKLRWHDRYLFVGSGTGISPFHCLVRSYPGIDYLLLHGVRHMNERIADASFEPSRCIACVSRGGGGDYDGRVTEWLRSHPVDPGLLCYLCGSSAMIDEAFAILREQGVPRDRLFAEVYF